jgi:hypothetical protein
MVKIKRLIKAAFVEVARNGWTPESIARLAGMFRNEALNSAFPQRPEQVVKPYLDSLFKKEIESGKFLKHHKGIQAFTVDRLQPDYRAMLDSMNRASIDLIVLERPNSIDVSTARFSSWLTGIPKGQQVIPDLYDLPAVKAITKPIDNQLSYEHSRRAIDQGHKLLTNINTVTALQGGAIAGVWHAHQKTDIYDARPEHWARNDKIYIMRDSWAHQEGLVKKTNGMWLEDIPDPPSVPVNCTCFWEYQYQIEALAKRYQEALTQKGIEYAA